jgi:hypothetical protein
MHVAYIWARSVARKVRQFGGNLVFSTRFKLILELISYRGCRVYGKKSKKEGVAPHATRGGFTEEFFAMFGQSDFSFKVLVRLALGTLHLLCGRYLA